jgi:2-hydroxy-3-oxopropionate reductase
VLTLISAWGKNVTIAGEKPGAAQVLKLVNNMLIAVSIVATSEAMLMGAKAGLDPEVMLAGINAGSGRNGASLSLFPESILTRAFDFGSPIDMLMKDVDLAISQGESLGVPMWVCQAARLVGKHAQFAGHGKDDVTALIKVVEAGANFELPRSAGAKPKSSQ